MKKQMRGLAAKGFLATAISLAVGSTATAGIPVVDGTNLVQTTVTAVQQVNAYAQQVQQYMTQLQQLENQITNTAALPQQIWDQVQNTINGLTSSMQGLTNLTNGAGDIQSYLNMLQNTNGYASQACFNGSACSSADVATLQANNATANGAVKTAADSELKALIQQQASLASDASNVQSLQKGASGAQGQKAALDAANQLASAQANQLVQIRALLVAQQTAAATALEQQNAKEAQQDAAEAAFYQTTKATVSTKTYDAF